MAGEILNRIFVQLDRKDTARKIQEATANLQRTAADTPAISAWRDQVAQNQYLPVSEPGGWRSTAKKTAIAAGLGAGAVILAKNVYKDKETGDFSSEELLNSFLRAGRRGLVEGIIGVAGITALHHREQTHRSIELADWLQKAIEFEQRTLTVAESRTWASVHRIHHQMTDASLFPFYQVFHAVKAAEKHGVPVAPDKKFKHLDPFVEQFDLQTVMEIGETADKMLRERMGDLYLAPEFTDALAVTVTLNPSEPQYWYPEQTTYKSRKDYTPNELARILLTDPHSPALVRRENGVQGVAMTNVGLYQTAAEMFRQFPELKPKDLQHPDDFDPEFQLAMRKRSVQDVVTGFVLQTGAMYLLNKDYTTEGLGKAILEGAAANGVRAATEIFGGNVTNSAGHMGDPIQTELAKAFLNRRYEIKLKPDGSISTNTIGKGIIGRLASWATLDEVGGQEIHHRDPWKIKYTDATGRQAVIEAPWGSLLHYLAYNDRVSFINPGKGFEGPNENRPDVVHSMVTMIQDARAKQFRHEYPDGYPEEPSKSSGGISRLARTVFKAYKNAA